MWQALLLVLAVQVGAGQAPPALTLTLASPVQFPDGRLLGTSIGAVSGSDPWYVFSREHLCQSVITQSGAPSDATDGWRVSVVERSRTDTQVTVGVTWFRMWERGQQVTRGSGGTSELTLQRGDRIGLDQIVRAPVPGVCAATVKGLELRIPATTVQSVSSAPEAALRGTVDAELWMVHQVPSGAEAVEHQTVRLTAGGIGFLFRGNPVDTTEGPVVIELSGTLKAVTRPDGTRALWAGIVRSVTAQATGRLLYTGTVGRTVDWLKPGDVVSFDLPDPALFARPGAGGAISGGGAGTRGGRGRSGASGSGTGAIAGVGGGVAAGGLGTNVLEGHQLSLRIRLIETPRP
jgi:hypothetical protein